MNAILTIRIFIGNLLYKLGIKPKIEAYGDNGEVIGGGFIRIKNRLAYHYGADAYIFPVTKLPDFIDL